MINHRFLWITCLQERIALSTLEAEYVAQLMAMCDQSPFKPLIHSIPTGIGIKKDQQFDIRCNVIDANFTGLALAKLQVPWMTPRSKHYAINYHSFGLV